MSAPVNPSIARLNPYQPGRPIDEVARELGLTDVAKLASNENPRGPAPAVRER
ncbi:MAG: histidinol-phosphate transaminase, partial [Gammaproteobacteria bacterium]|nr:histidinol-phosphate transaminase [Gammaproteobacteria bacterium]